jgi:hypothetical protein
VKTEVKKRTITFSIASKLVGWLLKPRIPVLHRQVTDKKKAQKKHDGSA